MFNKIKSRLSEVFSKTKDVIEEDEKQELETDIESQPQQKTQDVEENKEKLEDHQNQEDYYRHEEDERALQEDQDEVDSTEEKIEKEIEETQHDVEELDSVDSHEREDYQIKELESEQQEVDELDDKLEHEVEDVEKDVEDLDNVNEYEKHQQETQTNSEKKGFFSGLFSKKKKEEAAQEDDKQQETQLDEEQQSGAKEQELDSSQKSDVKEDKQERAEESQISAQEEKKEGFLHSAFSSITQKAITENDFKKLWAELELFLLEINVAYEIVEKIEKKMHLATIGNKFSRMSLNKKIKEVLVEEVTHSMQTRQGEFDSVVDEFLGEKKPVVIMMLGVNGTGKTTTIAKLIQHLQNTQKSVVVAAADTYRAAAVEQLDEHCQTLNVKCVKHKHGSDPAAVCYDAIDHAKAKGVDVVLIDTAGRMPNNSNLMDELKKIKRVSHTDMVLFIGDSVSGNDLIDQIDLFDKGLGVTGVILTKVDTDERPGSVVTTAYSINSPIYFLGTGQTYQDLVKFDAKHVAEQLFNEEEL
ncbi:MAG: signal recognition particle-docking protein FtsY [Candidatus Nanoarchaeia archaeon]